MLVWGWVLASILTICVSLALSELSSAFPVSGGLYFWAFMLGRPTGPFASWCVGWTNCLGQARWISDSLTSLHSVSVLIAGSLDRYPARGVLHLTYISHICTFRVLQIALVAADTFSCVQLFLSLLYLVSMETLGTGYYPSSALVSS